MKRILLIAVLLAACSGDETSENFPPIEELDISIPDLGPEPEDDLGVDLGPSEGRVLIDLKSRLRPVEGEASVYQVDNEEELIGGGAAHGRVGDWVLENEHIRVLIEADDRVMNPCPYGGNILDVSYKDGPSQDDILGEVCLFINATQTLDPDTYEVIETDNGAAVLAVTGTIQLGDYLNIPGMVGGFIPGLSLPFDFNKLLGGTLTIYYILHPGELGVEVVTAMRNDSDEEFSAVIAHLLMAGGNGGFFNPYGANRGFGNGGGLTNEAAVAFSGFLSENEGTMFVPEPREHLSTSFPRGGTSIYVSGVTAIASGIQTILGTLANRNFKEVEGVITLQPGEQSETTHWQFVGDGNVSTMLDEVYPLLGFETGVVSGKVLDSSGTPRAGARVSAVSETPERTMGQTRTDSEGNYSMRVPVGNYTIRARIPGASAPAPQFVAVDADEELTVPDLELGAPALLKVAITTPDGTPTPGRVTVICQGECPDQASSQEADVTSDSLPANWYRVVYVGMDGLAEIPIPAGAYTVAVTRGFEWTMWPYDARTNGGFPVNLAAGDELELDAEIAHVMDTTGALSADFHVHSLPSPDSPVPVDQRALNFLAEGVDVIVSTDHDIIADYAPSIAALGAESDLVSIVGVEITTGSTGHYNAFPVPYDAEARRGGALDWGRDRGNDMDPADIIAWARAQSGEQVVQVNHPDGSGYIGGMKADVLRGLSFTDREMIRLDPMDVDPETGDTGIWSEDFTAIEVMNGTSINRFWGVARWWLTMVGRGFTPTATAVTDTHRLYGDLGGSPRTWVFVPEANDEPLSFDEEGFARATNAGAAIGSRGPFMRITARNAAEEEIGLGETIAAGGEPVEVEVELSLPEWMDVTEIEAYINLEDVITPPGETEEAPLTPTLSVPVVLEETDLEVVATGTSVHRRYTKTVTFSVEADADSYVMIVAKGNGNMAPLAPGQTPFAFANPFYIDHDGGGYDNPPLAELASTPPPARFEQRSVPELTPEVLADAIHHGMCTH